MGLGTLGLAYASLSWSSTTAMSKVAGRTTLFTPNNGPAGLLVKHVKSLQEAVSVGGVYIHDEDDPSKWCFMVGTALVQAIGRRTIGHRAVADSDSSGEMFDLLNRNDWRYVQELWGKTQGWEVDDKLIYRETFFAGDIYQRFKLAPHFPSTAKLAVFGLVTGATEGLGFSSAGAPICRSYMATLVPMAVPFSKYMTDVKASQLARVPSDVRQYYEATFDSTLASYTKATERPTIAITTVWDGVNEVQIERWRPDVKLLAGPTISITSVNPRITASTIKSGLGTNNSSSVIERAVEGAAVGAWREVSTGKYRLMMRAGHKCSPFGTYKGLVLQGDDMPSEKLALQTGVVGGLHVGFLRDFHVMGRSLVSGYRYALDEPSHASVATLIAETIDDRINPDGDSVAVTKPMSLTQIEAIADQVVSNGKLGESCIYQRGSLPNFISDFNDLWDKNARALARQA